MICIPTRWDRWRTFETEEERFDLHNFVNAFCVTQGIATQFLEEDTLENELQCRIRWWLSLALYVKSMRIHGFCPRSTAIRLLSDSGSAWIARRRRGTTS